jgi:hypothetical protein
LFKFFQLVDVNEDVIPCEQNYGPMKYLYYRFHGLYNAYVLFKKISVRGIQGLQMGCGIGEVEQLVEKATAVCMMDIFSCASRGGVV